MTKQRTERKRSCVWMHYCRLNRDIARCDICKAVFSCKGGTTTNLKKHLVKKHSSVVAVAEETARTPRISREENVASKLPFPVVLQKTQITENENVTNYETSINSASDMTDVKLHLRKLSALTVFNLEEKMGMAKVICDLLARLAGNAASELFLKRLVVLTVLSDSWKAEDRDYEDIFVVEESFEKSKNRSKESPFGETINVELVEENNRMGNIEECNSQTGNIEVEEDDNWEVDDEIGNNYKVDDYDEEDKWVIDHEDIPPIRTVETNASTNCGNDLNIGSSRSSEKIMNINSKLSCVRNKSVVRSQSVSQAQSVPIPCERCGIMCKTIYELTRHLKRHDAVACGDSKDYSCDICGKKFFKPVYLQRHTTDVHMRVKECMCSLCGKVFTRPDQLRLHTRTHTGDLPFECKVCGKRFNTSPHLQKHSNIHTGYKPYVCKKCGRGYAMVVSLKSHSCETSRVEPSDVLETVSSYQSQHKH